MTQQKCLIHTSSVLQPAAEGKASFDGSTFLEALRSAGLARSFIIIRNDNDIVQVAHLRM